MLVGEAREGLQEELSSGLMLRQYEPQHRIVCLNISVSINLADRIFEPNISGMTNIT